MSNIKEYVRNGAGMVVSNVTKLEQNTEVHGNHRFSEIWTSDKGLHNVRQVISPVDALQNNALYILWLVRVLALIFEKRLFAVSGAHTNSPDHGRL